MTLNVIIERGEDGYYSAEVPFLAIDSQGNIYATWRLGLVKYAIEYP